MPYQGLKPTISKAKNRLRSIVRGKQPQPSSQSPHATRHPNVSLWSIAQSIKGMVSHRRVDQAAHESLSQDALPPLEREHEDKPQQHGPVPIIAFPDDLAAEFRNELEIAASTANTAMLEKLASTANVKRPENLAGFSDCGLLAEHLGRHGTRPKWIKASGADGKPFLLVDPLRMNPPEQIEEGEEEDADEGVAFVNKKGKKPVYKASKPL